MHWFNFLVVGKNTKKGDKIRLNIRNLVRNKSLYQEGMLPKIKFQTHSRDLGWHCNPNVTKDIRYFQTDQKDNFEIQFSFKQTTFYTLSFVYEVQQNNEEIQFAYDRPYTYSENYKQLYDRLRHNKKWKDIL